MKKFLPVFFIIIIFSAFVNSVLAQTPRGKLGTDVQAKIGEFYLNISGFASPFASIVMSLPALRGESDGTYIRSAVADQNGNFYISQVLIKRGFSGFCLTTIDFKRIGESKICFSFPPAQSDITMRDLFLPPTLGLARKEVRQGQEAIAFGYTMPGAKVTLYLDDGKRVTVTADEKGYFEIKIKDLKAGTYQLYVTGEYRGKNSGKPAKTVELKVISALEEISLVPASFLNKLWNLLTSIGLGPLWLLVPIIILIIILLKKLYPDLFTSIKEKIFVIFHKFLKRRKKLHHWWFVGY